MYFVLIYAITSLANTIIEPVTFFYFSGFQLTVVSSVKKALTAAKQFSPNHYKRCNLILPNGYHIGTSWSSPKVNRLINGVVPISFTPTSTPCIPTCNLILNLSSGLPHRIENTIHRLRLGVAFTTKFLNKLKKSTSPNCSTWHTPETVEHFLIVCTLHATGKAVLETTLSNMFERPLTVEKVFGNWGSTQCSLKATNALIVFLRDTGLARALWDVW